jgi:nitrilase
LRLARSASRIGPVLVGIDCPRAGGQEWRPGQPIAAPKENVQETQHRVTTLRVAAVQAAPVLMDASATIDRVGDLAATASVDGAELVVFPEVFVPGTPVWIDTARIWDEDDDWYALLADQAVVVPSAETERIGEIARDAGVWLVIGVNERDGGTIYNTVLYFAPDGTLANTHRKLMPTGSERTVWGMGDGSTLRTIATPFGRLGGLTCWENYMPLARFHLYAQGVDVWVAPTLAPGDGWVATMRHLAREGRMFVIGVNPCTHADQLPAALPRREALYPAALRERDNGWLEPGNTVIVDPAGNILAGPVREEQRIVTADLDLGLIRTQRRHFDPVGHYNRPDVFRLEVDTSPRPAVVETTLAH